MELNREQIIKAFECCHTLSSDCSSCPFLEDRKACACLPLMALALIRELTEENEFHRKTISENAQMALEVAIDEIEKAKADAVWKFADYLKKKSFCCDPGNWLSFDAIDADELDDHVKRFLEESK